MEILELPVAFFSHRYLAYSVLGILAITSWVARYKRMPRLAAAANGIIIVMALVGLGLLIRLRGLPTELNKSTAVMIAAVGVCLSLWAGASGRLGKQAHWVRMQFALSVFIYSTMLSNTDPRQPCNRQSLSDPMTIIFCLPHVICSTVAFIQTFRTQTPSANDAASVLPLHEPRDGKAASASEKEDQSVPQTYPAEKQ